LDLGCGSSPAYIAPPDPLAVFRERRGENGQKWEKGLMGGEGEDGKESGGERVDTIA